MATLESRLADLITAIGADVKDAIPFTCRLDELATLQYSQDLEFIFPDDAQLLASTFSVTTAPTGATAIFDIFKNGATVFSSYPTISTSGFLASAGTLTGATTFTARTDYLQIRCSQIGSTIAGADLAVILNMRLV